MKILTLMFLNLAALGLSAWGGPPSDLSQIPKKDVKLNETVVKPAIDQSGTEVGTGDASALKAQLQQLKDKYKDLDYEKAEVEELKLWSEDVAGVLNSAVVLSDQLLGQSNEADAALILDITLTQVGLSLKKDSTLTTGPLTKILVDRGKRMSMTLDELIEGAKKAEVKDSVLKAMGATKILFLHNWIGFIVETQASLDRPYYINFDDTYLKSNREPMMNGTEYGQAFEEQYIEYTSNQLSTLLDGFKYRLRSYTGTTPKYYNHTKDLTLVLKLMEMVSFDTVNDLNRIFHEKRIQEFSDGLLEVSESLKLFNESAVPGTHAQIDKIKESRNAFEFYKNSLDSLAPQFAIKVQK